ncbi:MAG: hypothetical protein ACK5XN_28275 [Bacteroidota bacterium]
MKTLLTFIVLTAALTTLAYSQSKEKKRVIYEYKKFENFDFEEIGVEGQSGAPGDLSVAPTPKKDYNNRLPERKDFLKEMRKSASGIR